jgi:hypothetical protein
MLSKKVQEYLGAPLKILAEKGAALTLKKTVKRMASFRSLVIVVSLIAALTFILASVLPVKASGDSSPPGFDPTPTVVSASAKENRDDDSDGEVSSGDNATADVLADSETGKTESGSSNDGEISTEAGTGTETEPGTETGTETESGQGSPDSQEDSAGDPATEQPQEGDATDAPAAPGSEENADNETSDASDTDQQVKDTEEVEKRLVGDDYAWADGIFARTITITAAGDRSGSSDTVNGLDGAVYVAIPSGSTLPPAAPENIGDYYYCTTGSAQGTQYPATKGVCRIKVSALTSYWIVQFSAPAPYSVVPQVALRDSDNSEHYGYAFHIEPSFGNVSVPSSATASHVPSTYDTTAGKWINVRTNPEFPGMCLADAPLKVALVIDQSGSVSASELSTMKDAATAFVSSQGLGLTNTEVGIYKFGTGASVVKGATSVRSESGIAEVSQAIASITKPTVDEATNWDHALRLVGTSWDAVVMLTDGNPTRYLTSGAGLGTATDLRAMEEAIYSANYLKSQGTSILTVGIGMPEKSRVNLEAISSSEDTYDASNFEDLYAVLHTIAQRSQCTASIRVQKSVTDVEGNNPTTLAGWPMMAAKTSDNAGGTVELCEIAGATRTCRSDNTTSTLPTTGASDMAQWALQFSSPSGQSANVSIDEGTLTSPEHAGYEFVKYSYTIKHANGTSDTTVEVTAPGPQGFSVENLEPGDELMVVYTNKPRPAPSVGSVAWQKKDSDGAFLAGTVWELTKTSPEPSQTIEVTDNTGQSGYTGVDDDAAPGKFSVIDVDLGEYTLTEKSAPEGYVVDATPHAFTLTADGYTFATAFVNQRKTGSVVWRKIDAATQDPLEGSVWTLTALASGSDPVTVEDNTGQSGYDGADVDATAGSFRLEGLTWGSYELVESKAPFGYVLDTTTHSFEISATNLDFEFGSAFENHRPDLPALPLTGGASSDAYWIAGGLTVVLTLICGFGVHLYQKTKEQQCDS